MAALARRALKQVRTPNFPFQINGAAGNIKRLVSMTMRIFSLEPDCSYTGDSIV